MTANMANSNSLILYSARLNPILKREHAPRIALTSAPNPAFLDNREEELFDNANRFYGIGLPCPFLRG